MLDARNRLGGRVDTRSIDPKQQLVIEMGGEWIGKSQTRIRKLCDEFGLPVINHLLAIGIIKDKQYLEPGKWKFSDELEKHIKELKENQAFNLNALKGIDAWHYLSQTGIPKKDIELLDLIESVDFGENLRFVPAQSLISNLFTGSTIESMDCETIQGGNKRLVSALAHSIGEERIQLCAEVEKIVSNHESVEVTCKDKRVFRGNALICTAPAYAITKILWSPELPKIQWNAMEALDYARINKTAILFSTRFWKNDSFAVFSESIPHQIYHATQNQKGEKGVLVSYATGDSALIMAKMTKEEQAREVCMVLEKLFGNVAHYIERVENYYWGDDPYTSGAYALFDDYTIERQFLLAQPAENIFFAGEHTSVEYSGFMEGAIESGQRAAREVLAQ